MAIQKIVIHREAGEASAVEATFREIRAALAREEEDYGFFIALVSGNEFDVGGGGGGWIAGGC